MLFLGGLIQTPRTIHLSHIYNLLEPCERKFMRNTVFDKKADATNISIPLLISDAMFKLKEAAVMSYVWRE